MSLYVRPLASRSCPCCWRWCSRQGSWGTAEDLAVPQTRRQRVRGRRPGVAHARACSVGASAAGAGRKPISRLPALRASLGVSDQSRPCLNRADAFIVATFAGLDALAVYTAAEFITG